MALTLTPQQHPYSSGPYCGGKPVDSPPCSPLPHSTGKSLTKSASLLETGTGAETLTTTTTTSSLSGAQIVSDISSAKEAVCFMGFPEPLVQLAIDVQRLDHGTDFTDATQLFLAVDDLTQNSCKQVEYAKKLHEQAEKGKVNKTVPDELKEKDIENHAPCPPKELEVVSSKQVSPDMPEKLQERVKVLAKENQKLKKRKMCRACRKVELATSGITFLPCGHFITCEGCSEMFDDCPACGKNIMGTVRTFLS